jgi:multidrug resistance efflux pump
MASRPAVVLRDAGHGRQDDRTPRRARSGRVPREAEMRDASAQELLLLSALQECRIQLDAARGDEAQRTAIRDELQAALRREAALRDELVQERERTEAVRLVLRAFAASIGRFGLRRRLFLSRIARLGRETPDSGPQSARHQVLLDEARHVLGTGRQADPVTGR